jgi:hypothetical protein
VSWGERAPGAARRRRPRFGPVLWALLPLLSWGLLAPVPFIHAAVRLRTVGMWLVAACYVLAWAVVGPAGVLAQDPDPNDAVAAFSQLGLVVAATAHAFVLRPRVFPAPGAGDPAVAAALEARERRGRARAMLASDPALARELRIGRPDLPRQFEDGGLVDVNHVPAQVLVDRLGLTPEEAGRVVEARAQLGRYSSPAELAVYAELPDAAVEAVRRPSGAGRCFPCSASPPGATLRAQRAGRWAGWRTRSSGRMGGWGIVADIVVMANLAQIAGKHTFPRPA